MRQDNSNQIPKSIITQSTLVDAKTTQLEAVNDGQVTAKKFYKKDKKLETSTLNKEVQTNNNHTTKLVRKTTAIKINKA